MATQILSLSDAGSYWSVLRNAAAVLREGGLVAFPTETVYGVGAVADQPGAIERLRHLKNRSPQTPFTVHVGRVEVARKLVPQMTRSGRRLMNAAWPGPLTLIFDVTEEEQTRVVDWPVEIRAKIYHQGTVGIRYPDHSGVCDLINESGGLLLASSANPAGAAPPVSAQSVQEYLDGEIDLLLDDGLTRYRAPSSIVRVSRNGMQVLREGVLERRVLEKMAQTLILLVCTGNTCRSPMAEGWLRKRLADHLGVAPAELEQQGLLVRSAGTMGMMGSPAAPEAVEVMQEVGVDISSHRSSALTPELLHQAQWVLVMTEAHRQAVLRMVPGMGDRVRLVAGDRDIEDPLGSSKSVYEQCRIQIATGLEQYIAEILA